MADSIALAHFRRDLDIERKPDRTFVTVADQAIEREIRTRIQARWPGDGLVGEEYGTQDGDAATRWYIDPIDGTHNFIRGVPLFGTLLAVEHEGELQVGVISAPAMHERWYAYRGVGAWNRGLDGERQLHVSRVNRLEDAQIVYGSRRDTMASGLMPGFDALISTAWRERGFGDFWAYALVAEGAAEAMLETGIHSWDIAAPMVLIEEAGGRVTDVNGDRRVDAPSFVGSNGHLHEAVFGGCAPDRPRAGRVSRAAADVRRATARSRTSSTRRRPRSRSGRRAAAGRWQIPSATPPMAPPTPTIAEERDPHRSRSRRRGPVVHTPVARRGHHPVRRRSAPRLGVRALAGGDGRAPGWRSFLIAGRAPASGSSPSSRRPGSASWSATSWSRASSITATETASSSAGATRPCPRAGR